MPKGGARPGAGRKSYNLSEKEKRSLLSAARRKQRETGKRIADILLEMIYDPQPDPKAKQIKLTAIRVYYDVITVKEGFKTVEKHNYAPAIGLPPIKERPKEIDFFIPVESKKLS
ncbi:MAG: hypothetical protein FJ110_12385 [Deltaproteobacteria bacterium]|nr:hypothetical protein [Deltaproteobacteria bacterium]